jgi:hypothetical protein
LTICQAGVHSVGRGTDGPGGNAAVSQAPAPRLPTDAFLLGLDIEEIYMVFAEGFQLAGGGVSSAQYEVIDRKVGRVHDLLLGYGCPADLVRRFDEAASMVQQADEGDANLDFEALAADTASARDELGNLMVEVRGHLAADDGRLYDIGVMLARLHLCVRILASEHAPANYREIYGSELERVFAIVSQFLEEAEAEGVLDRLASEPFGRELQNFLPTLPPWDGGSSGWCEAVRERLDHLFGATGITAHDPTTRAAVRPTEALPPAFVAGGCANEVVFLMVGWALDLEHVPEIARPARVARGILLTLGASPEALLRFEDVVSGLLREQPDAAAIRRAGDEIEGLTAALRESLTPDDGQLFDLGAVTSQVRFGLGIALARAAATTEHEPDPLPGTDLEPFLAEFAQRVTEMSGVLERAASAVFADRFYRLRDVLLSWDGGTAAWCRAAAQAYDQFFGEPAALAEPIEPQPQKRWWRRRGRG